MTRPLCLDVTADNKRTLCLCSGARDVLLLKLWATVFPVSDKRHPVTTPLALLTSSYLSLCPVTCHRDAAIGTLQLPSFSFVLCPTSEP